MTRTIRSFATLLTFSLLTTSCSPSLTSSSITSLGSTGLKTENSNENPSHPNLDNSEEPLAGTLTVTDAAGNAIAGAKVMIGMRENVPFAGNIVTTDSSGQIAIPAQWTDAQPVTVEANNYVRATYFGRTPQATKLILNRAPTAGRLELTGANRGFGDLPTDGFLDIGLVFPLLSRAQANTLEIGALLSSEMDRMTVFGQDQNVPSNLTFPKQRERYGITLTFEKPVFRTYFPSPKTYRVVAAHVRFPARETIDAMRAGKGFMDLVNGFDFRQAALKDVAITRPSQGIELAVNGMTFEKSFSFTAPRFNANSSVFAVPLIENEGQFYPTDVKRFNSGETKTLSAPQGSSVALIASILKRRESDVPTGALAEERSSVTVPANQAKSIEFLDHVAAPVVKTNSLVITPPRAVTNVVPALTYAILSKVETSNTGEIKLEKKTPQWELYAQDWASSLELPEMPDSGARPSGQMRWEVAFAGRQQGTTRSAAGPNAFEGVSHVTRSAVDF